MIMSTASFQSEDVLISKFVEFIRAGESPWGSARVAREFDYQRGRTDVVLLTSSGQVVAFEAKLSRWRDALHQAYRNLCFADRSFIVLPRDIAERAVQFTAEFSKRGVGVCYVCSEGGIVVLLEATEEDPPQPWLRADVVRMTRPTE